MPESQLGIVNGLSLLLASVGQIDKKTKKKNKQSV